MGVRAPRQERGRASWERLLDAAEELLGDEGFARFTIAELSRRSGISNGGIYWRVDSLEALFTAVHERFIERLADELHAFDDPGRWSELDLEAFVAATVRVQADVFHRHAGMLRAMALRTATDEAAAARGAAAVRSASERFSEHLGARLAADGCSEPTVVAVSIFRVVFGALIARVTWPEQQGDPDIPWDRFVDDVCEMAAAYATRHVQPAAR